MKVLIVYDTVSPMRVTEKVAQTIGEVLKEMGIDVDSLYVKDVNVSTVKNYDCLIAGAPTMAFRVSSEMKRFLETLPREGFSGELAAAFDTQIQSRLSGSAAKGIDGKLKDLGFRLVTASLIVYVEGKGNEWRLKEGESEKAKNWAKTVAEALQSQSS
jgi:flavodoxin